MISFDTVKQMKKLRSFCAHGAVDNKDIEKSSAHFGWTGPESLLFFLFNDTLVAARVITQVRLCCAAGSGLSAAALCPPASLHPLSLPICRRESVLAAVGCSTA